MTNPSRSSSLGEDPLHAYSGLALFPRTLKSMSIPLLSRLYQSDDLQHTHNFLDSMPFEVQNELQDQAKAILAESSELFKQGIRTSIGSKAESVEMNLIPNQRERRPGLGRTRARFSFKPTTSQPPPNEPNFDVSKYQNPEDFFAAYEKFENAKREWQKQTGSTSTDTNQNQPSMRPRRPGISGRVRGSYKHRYSTDTINLEASEKDVSIPSAQSSPERTTAAHVTPVDREVDDSTMDIEKNVDNILGELLACTQDELEGDGAVNLLEERLQIKPIDIGKLSLPEFQDVGKIDLKASGRRPSNRRTVLSSIQNMLKGIHSDGARKSSQSPWPLNKSPVASLSLRKPLSSPNPPADQFSFPDSRHALLGDLSARSLNQQSIEVELAKDSSICSRSSAINSDNDRTNVSLPNVDIVNVDSPLNSSLQKSSKENGLDSCPGIHSSHSISDGTAENCVNDNVTNRNSATPEVKVTMQAKGDEGYLPMGGIEMNRDTGRSENDADTNADTHQLDNLAEDSSREGHSTVEKDSFPCQQDKSSKSPNGAPEYAEHIEEQQGAENNNTDTACGLQVESVEEVHNCSHEQTNKRRKRGSGDNNRKKRSKTLHEGDNQMETNESGAKKRMKRTTNEREEENQKKAVTREGKVFSRRKSLAAAGTKWETGVRRSTRIKSRPLEYWKGERFLFGRIHESLATVIGIKYESPGKSENGKPSLKVKSFVSDEYNELIELAALH